MQKALIKPGTHYAIREKRGAPLQRVRVIEHLRGDKWRAEWIEPNPGLTHFVQSSQIVCRWKEHKAFVREESAKDAIRAHNQKVGFKDNTAIERAVSSVFDCVGDEVSFYRGVLSGSPEAMDRIRGRAGVSSGAKSGWAYTNRAGMQHVPFDEALDIARRFAGTEPATVLTDVETTERKWAHDVTVPGQDYLSGLLSEYRAAWALIRQWTGHDPAIAQREAEIQKLERLVWDAIYALQKAGLDSESRRLRRALGRE